MEARKGLKQNDFLGKAFLLHNKLTVSDSLSWHLLQPEPEMKYQQNIFKRKNPGVIFFHLRKLSIYYPCLTHFKNEVKNEVLFCFFPQVVITSLSFSG